MSHQQRGIARFLWWLAVAVVVGFTVWDALTSTMYDIDLGCAKTTEGGPGFRCEDRVIDILGPWPLIGSGALMAGPPLVAAVAGRPRVSWAAVGVLAAEFLTALFTLFGSYWFVLVWAVVPAAIGAGAAAVQSRGTGSTPDPGRPWDRAQSRK